jgi:hypothetical protein
MGFCEDEWGHILISELRIDWGPGLVMGDVVYYLVICNCTFNSSLRATLMGFAVYSSAPWVTSPVTA